MSSSLRYRASKNTLEPARVRTDGTRAEPNELDERVKARVAQNSAYEKYKASLHAYFNGDQPLPDNLREMLATRPGAEQVFGEEKAETHTAAAPVTDKKKAKAGRGKRSAERDGTERKARRMVSSSGNDYATLLSAVRKAASPRESEESLNAFRSQGHALPLEAEVLSKALGHSDEELVREALEGLLRIPEQVKSPRLLKTRLDNVVLMARSSEVKSLCDELKAKLVG